MASLDWVDRNEPGRGVFWTVIHEDSWYKDLFWGLTENSSIFCMVLLIPSLMAIKHRQTHG